ncbi:MAG: hypothetical protein VXW31_06565, partial [Planctomycetota bacterium]|nr:hypothetical protein [Planctomycetota bacterium]
MTPVRPHAFLPDRSQAARGRADGAEGRAVDLEEQGGGADERRARLREALAPSVDSPTCDD